MFGRTLFLAVGLWCLTGYATSLFAYSDLDQKPTEILEQAKTQLYRFQNDSALTLLQPLLDRLELDEVHDSFFGLQVQLAIATAFRQDNQYKKAIGFLQTLKDKSKEAKQWEVFAGACLELSTLYEHVYRKGDAKVNLDLARSIIEQHNLEQIYPLFLVRIAFWHQDNANFDSAGYYANLAQVIIKDTDRPDLEAVFYSLLGIISWKEDYRTAIGYHQYASQLLRKTGDFVNLSYNWHRIARILAFNYQHEGAIRYNDSTIMACYWAIAAGQDQIPILHEAYQEQGRMHEILGHLDSAMFYTKKGYSQEIKFIQQQESDRVIEIDEQYKDEQKAQQLLVKEQQLRLSGQRLTGLLVIIFFILVFAALLFQNYARLRKANNMVVEQSQIITETNTKLATSLEQQIVLQGEIHHRVKNNLQVIISLIGKQKKEITDQATRESLDAMSSRIYSMAAIHDELYRKEGEHLVDFVAYAKKICHHLSVMAVYGKPRFELNLPKQLFNLETLMPLGIILNELLTNSIKYANQKGKELIINIQMVPQKDGFLLSYRDNGPGFSAGQLQDREGGLGAYLIRTMSRQLRGSLETRNEGGAAYHIYFREKNRVVG